MFFTTLSQLVSADTDSSQDLYERSGGTTTRVSAGEINGNGAIAASFSRASSDGSKVFFHTQEQLVSADTDASTDVYERSGGTTTRVSAGEINGNGGIASVLNGISSDGSKAFFSTTEQLVSADTDSSQDLYERSGGTTTRVSAGAINGNGANNASFSGASSDGSKVFFVTAEQLVERRHRQLAGPLRALGRDDDARLGGRDQRQRCQQRLLQQGLERRLEGVLHHGRAAGQRRH